MPVLLLSCPESAWAVLGIAGSPCTYFPVSHLLCPDLSWASGTREAWSDLLDGTRVGGRWQLMERRGSGNMEPRVGSWSWLAPPFPSRSSAVHQQHSSGKGSVSKSMGQEYSECAEHPRCSADTASLHSSSFSKLVFPFVKWAHIAIFMDQ